MITNGDYQSHLYHIVIAPSLGMDTMSAWVFGPDISPTCVRQLRELRTRCVNTKELNGEDELNHLLELQHVQIKESNGGTR